MFLTLFNWKIKFQGQAACKIIRQAPSSMKLCDQIKQIYLTWGDLHLSHPLTTFRVVMPLVSTPQQLPLYVPGQTWHSVRFLKRLSWKSGKPVCNLLWVSYLLAVATPVYVPPTINSPKKSNKHVDRKDETFNYLFVGYKKKLIQCVNKDWKPLACSPLWLQRTRLAWKPVFAVSQVSTFNFNLIPLLLYCSSAVCVSVGVSLRFYVLLGQVYLILLVLSPLLIDFSPAAKCSRPFLTNEAVRGWRAARAFHKNGMKLLTKDIVHKNISNKFFTV